MAFTRKHIPDIGEVLIVKSRRARRLTLSIKPDNSIRATIPSFCSYRIAESFIRNKKRWLIEKLEEASDNIKIYYRNAERVTAAHSLNLKNHKKREVNVNVSEGVITVFYPDWLDVSNNKVQSAVKKGVNTALRIEAVGHLPQRLRFLAEEHGFKYGRLTLRDSRTRWGSCSASNNINLSIHLMKLPYRLVDYVILHELAHTVHKNHGRDFWNLLELVSGDAKGMAKEMKEYSIYRP